MPTGTVSPSPSVTVSITRDPALVRTVRLVAAAVARRADRNEDFVEEVRLAVGEACALLLGDDTDGHHAVSVHLDLATGLTAEVSCDAPVDVDDPPHSDIDGAEPWALLRGLVDDIDVSQRGSHTHVRMSWLV